ncbi:MAG: DUF177 domain-containing protein [Acidobacteriota bacterium]|jgi:uncharacterized protein|nr:DUF177 domain-containing protein [Acidobacteriota bacterium]MDQ3420610.1 DUF177 domain-containing protein [Acidobacteriota bacterium]
MFLDLSQLHGAAKHYERRFEPSAFDPPDEDYRVAGPVGLVVDVEKAGGNAFRVTGHVTTKLMLECGRCLEEFELPIDSRFELRYVPAVDAATEPEREIAEDDLATAFYREGTLDVIEMLREQFQLALPMKPLHDESCRGLCPICGANLNRTECGCTPKWEDPRLAPLKGLLSPEKES